MSKVPNPIRIYRMVHWENVEFILNNGLSCREHPNADSDYINIGHRQLISDRHNYPVKIDNGGTLGEYVPFYFAGHSPMLFLIMNGFSGVTRRPQEDIVFVATTFEAIQEHNLEYVFTDRNAKLSLSNFYNQQKDFNKLNWTAIKSKNWNATEDDLERKDLKQAEFLIRNYVPISCIKALIVKSENRKIHFEKLITKLDLNIKVFIDSTNKLYY